MNEGASAMTTEAKDAGEVLHEWVDGWGIKWRVVPVGRRQYKQSSLHVMQAQRLNATLEWVYECTAGADEIALLAARLSALEDCVRLAACLHYQRYHGGSALKRNRLWADLHKALLEAGFTEEKIFDASRARVGELPAPAGEEGA